MLLTWLLCNCNSKAWAIMTSLGNHFLFFTRVLSVTFDDLHLATGSSDRTVKLWSLSTGGIIRTYRGHKKGVWFVRFFTGLFLISSSYDTTIKVLSIRLWFTYEVIKNNPISDSQAEDWETLKIRHSENICRISDIYSEHLCFN